VHNGVAFVVIFALAACRGRANDDSPAKPDAAVLPQVANDCTADAHSTLPGVTLRFSTTRCTFTLAQARAGIAIDYEVVVDQNRGAWQSSDRPPGPSGLVVSERLGGSGETYGLEVNTGLVREHPITLARGTYPASFKWDGVNSAGALDASQRKGLTFPPGTYRLEVRAVGSFADGKAKRDFELTGAFSVKLVP